jgi:hypothetical protein
MPKIYNFDSYPVNPLTNEEWIRLVLPAMREEYPCEGPLWYPSFRMTRSWLDYALRSSLNEDLPAYIADLVTWAVGGKPKAVRSRQKVSKVVLRLHHFVSVSK